jgi:hypothetical protein
VLEIAALMDVALTELIAIRILSRLAHRFEGVVGARVGQARAVNAVLLAARDRAERSFIVAGLVARILLLVTPLVRAAAFSVRLLAPVLHLVDDVGVVVLILATTEDVALAELGAIGVCFPVDLLEGVVCAGNVNVSAGKAMLLTSKGGAERGLIIARLAAGVLLLVTPAIRTTTLRERFFASAGVQLVDGVRVLVLINAAVEHVALTKVVAIRILSRVAHHFEGVVGARGVDARAVNAMLLAALDRAERGVVIAGLVARALILVTALVRAATFLEGFVARTPLFFQCVLLRLRQEICREIIAANICSSM